MACGRGLNSSTTVTGSCSIEVFTYFTFPLLCGFICVRRQSRYLMYSKIKRNIAGNHFSLGKMTMNVFGLQTFLPMGCYASALAKYACTYIKYLNIFPSIRLAFTGPLVL